MTPVSWPNHGEAWIRGVIEREMVVEKRLRLEPKIGANIPPALHAAYRLANKVAASWPVKPSGPRWWVTLKAKMRARQAKRIARILRPQREFNATLVAALLAHIQTTEARLLALETQYRQCLAKLAQTSPAGSSHGVKTATEKDKS